MDDPVELILSRLRELGHEPRRSGEGWACICPAHEDQSPSLSVGYGDTGDAVVFCHAKCKVDSILASLSLTKRDLFAAGGERGTLPMPQKRSKPARAYPTWESALGRAVRDLGKPVTFHEYRTADGTLVGGVARYEPAQAPKTFRQCSTPDNGKTWSATAFPAPRPLLYIDEVLAAETVYVCEGEKAADALQSIGLTATTSAGGSSAAKFTDWGPLAEKNVVIVPDHDEAGETYANDVVRLATKARAKGVAVVRLVAVWPEVPAGGDAFDWTEAHDATEPESLRGIIEGLAENAKPVVVAQSESLSVHEVVSGTGSNAEDIDAIPLSARPWPSRPAAMLSHGVIGDLLTRVEEETEADPVAIATTFLVSLGNVIGRGPYFAVDGNRHGVNLFATIVGGTSAGRKGTSMSIVRAIFRGIDDDWVRNCKTPSLTSGEGLIDLIRDDEHVVKLDAKTGEPRTTLVPGVADKRLLFECQELAAVMRAAKQERSTLFPTLREAWDGQDLRTPTKNNPRKVTGPHVSGVCHITPEELAKLQTVAEIHGGTWNRFLWVAARRARLCPHGGDFEDLREIQGRVRSVVVNAQNVGRMRRTAAADRLWEREYFRRAECPPGGVVGAILGRAEAQILRLSMLAALCRGESVIDEVDLAAAIDLWRYVDDTVRMLFGKGEDPLVSKIIAAVRAVPRISRSDLHRAVAKTTPASMFVATLAKAAAMGEIFPETIDTGGRPREVWQPREMQRVSKTVRPTSEPFSPLSPLSSANGSEFGRTL